MNEEVPNPPGATVRRRLLVLDDEEAMGQTIANIAVSAGFEALAVADADAFFVELVRWSPSHIALDLLMPEVDGIEVLRRLGDTRCEARIVITSGVDSRVLEAARQSALEHGLAIIGVISKPFTPSRLRAILNGAEARVTGTHPAIPPARRDIAVSAPMLEEAMARDELSLVYQPKVRCQDGAVAGFEALARWNHPVHGFIPPDRFIVAAETHGLIDPLTERIFEQALSWFTSLPPALADAKLSLNVSRRSLGDIGFADRLTAQCATHGVTPARVILEITETSALADPTTSLDLLTRLRFKGFRLSIDDFGIGYSSIAQLVRLPFSELKIDKSFVMNAASSAESRTIIRTMVSLAHSLALEVTAEGVEDGAALDILREHRCDLAQGYHIARPMVASALEEWLDRRRATDADRASSS